MKRHFENLSRKAGRMIRHWWLMMLVGILVIATGICVFVFPIQSYVTLSILFGVLMLLSGAVQLIVASSSGNYLMMRGYVIAGGVLDILLGIFLCVYPAVTLVLLPVMMGLWMLYHSFIIIAFGGDMDTFRIPGGGWVIMGGLLLLLFSMLVLVNPLGTGIDTVLAIAGTGLLLLGLMICSLSLRLRTIHLYFDESR